MAEIGVMKKLTIGGSTYTIPEYSLPIASASTLGGVKIGTGLTINSTTGVLSATGLDFDEADPVFTASAAYGITSTDITNWNSKTSNTGTITKVQTSAGAHTTVNVSSGNVSFSVPTKTSHLTNDSGFLTSSDLASVLKYQGTKASVANLPTTGNTTGDVWHITADGSEYAWDGSIWQELGTAIDLSGYALKSELPTDTNTWRTIQVNDSDILGSGINTGKLNLKAGTNVSITNSGGTVTISATDTNTDEKLKWTASTSSNTYYPLQSTSTATTSTANTLNSVSFYQYYNTAGGYRRFILGNTTAYTSSGGAYGTIRLYGTGATYYGDLNPGTIGTNSLTANRTWTLPDKTGTIALTSDIPDVSGFITSDSDEKLKVAAVTSGTTYYPIVGTGTTAATRQYDTTGFIYKGTNGTTSAVGSAQLTLGNSTASGTANNKQGQLIIYGSTAYAHTISGAPTAARTLTLPNASGTIALTSDIPTVPTSTGSSETGITASTTATKTTLGTAGSVTGVQSSTTTASKVTVGSHSTDYGVKTAGSGSYTQGTFTGGSFTQGTDSFTANVPTKIDTSKFNAGSYSHSGFSGGSGSFSATVTSHVLSFSHTHTAASYGTDSFTAPSLGSGFYTAGTAASFTQGEDEFTPATHGADSHTHTAPTLGSKIPTVSATDVTVPIKNTSATSIPNVSVASATVTITDPGHTHTI